MGLNFRDIENLCRNFPAENGAGQPNWAVSGGGAVMLMLAADAIDGLTCIRGPQEDRREHKDLDVAVFSKFGAKLKIEYPHELYRCEFWHTPRRCNYRSDYCNPTGFYIELFSGYHFGFTPPQRADAVRCRCEEGPVWTVSPEYIVASRLFGLAPIRTHEDLQDIAALKQRFLLDPEKIASHVAKSPLAFLTLDEIEKIAVGRDLDLLERRVEGEAANRFPLIAPLFPSQGMSCLLRFAPGELDQERMLEAVERAKQEFGHRRYSLTSAWAAAFCLCVVDGADPGLDNVMDEQGNTIYQHDEQNLRMAAQFAQGMAALKRSLSKARYGDFYDRLAPRLVERFVLTPYKHVLLSALPVQAARFAECTCREEVSAQCELLSGFFPPKIMGRLL